MDHFTVVFFLFTDIFPVASLQQMEPIGQVIWVVQATECLVSLHNLNHVYHSEMHVI